MDDDDFDLDALAALEAAALASRATAPPPQHAPAPPPPAPPPAITPALVAGAGVLSSDGGACGQQQRAPPHRPAANRSGAGAPSVRPPPPPSSAPVIDLTSDDNRRGGAEVAAGAAHGAAPAPAPSVRSAPPRRPRSPGPPDLVDLPWLAGGVQLDRRAASFWLAPSSPPLRPYQASIAATALLHNTLVCLPTGTGKTLVAATLLSNFARWFPAGLTVFLAPTRPLVAQQAASVAAAIGAGEGEVVLAVGGGARAAAGRADVWHAPATRHVFTTPQAFHNDVRLGACPVERVTCVVVDECHRAVGRADGAAALRRLAAAGVKARVVGLSATPGSTREAVQEVVTNLGAARIEFRADGDDDLAPFAHARAAATVVVPPPPGPGPARAAACRALRRALAEAGGAYRGPADPASVPRPTLLAAARDADAGGDPPAAAWLRAGALLAGVRDALDAYGLAAARDLLAGDAAVAAAAPLAAAGDAGWAALTAATADAAAPGDAKLAALKAELASVLEGGAGGDRGRPAPDRARAIVFTSLRERVASVVDALRSDGVDARAFVGQGLASAGGGGGGRGRGRGAAPAAAGRGGMKQSEQAAVLAAFRAGAFPVLVATAIGEEGLDVPSVDVVVGLDAAAPLRAAQRAGRTARGRPGRVVVLVEAGREEAAHRASVESTNALHAALRAQAFDLARAAPRMLPREFVPVRVDAPPPVPAPAPAPARPRRPRPAAAVAPAAAAPPPARATVAGLLHPADSGRVVRVGDDGGLVVDPPPVRLVGEGEDDDDADYVEDDDDNDGGGEDAAAPTARPPLAPRALPQRASGAASASPVAARLSQMTVSDKGPQTGGGDAVIVVSDDDADGPASSPPPFAPDTASAGDVPPWPDGGGDDGFWGADDAAGGGWGLSGAGAAPASLAPGRPSSPSTAPAPRRSAAAPIAGLDTDSPACAPVRAAAGAGRRALLDSASPAAAPAAAAGRRALLDSASPAPRAAAARTPRDAAHRPDTRRLASLHRVADTPPPPPPPPPDAAVPGRLARKRARAQAVAAPSRRRAPAAAAALVDDEASASDREDGADRDSDDGSGFESSFVSDDGGEPGHDGAAAAAARAGAFAAYRAAVLASDDGTPAWRGRGRRGGRAAPVVVDTPGAHTRATDDAYDEDDSFLASEDGDGDGGGGTQTGPAPSQHETACGACGRGGGALLACARCPAVAHAACVRAREGAGGRSWLCAVCGDD